MILSVQEVTKQYDKHLAVDKVSFDMREGTIFGMLGPNGAGKTSLIRMITTITGPDSGTILLDGQKNKRLHTGKNRLYARRTRHVQKK